MLLSQTIKYLPAQVLAPLSQFLSIIFWTHLGDEKMIGLVTLVTVFQELSMAVFVQWWMHYSMREYGGFVADGRVDAYWATSRSVLLLSSVGVVGSSLMNLYWLIEYDVSTILALVVSVFSVCRAINFFAANMATVEANILRFTVLSLSGPLLGLLLGLWLLYIYGADPLYPLVGYALGELLGLFYLLVSSQLSAWRLGRKEWRLSWSSQFIGPGLHYGAPMIVSAAASWVTLHFPRYFLADQLGLEAAGQYSVGVGLGQRVASLITMVVTPAALPAALRIAHERGSNSALDQLGENFSLLCVLLLPGLVGLYMVSPLLIPLLIDPDFVDTTLVLLPWALLTGGIYAVKSGYVNHMFFIAKNTRPIMSYDLLAAALTVVFCLALVSRWQIVGAAIAPAAALFLVVAVVIAWQLSRGRAKFQYSVIAQIALATAVMAALIAAVNIQVGQLAQLVLQIVIGAAVYFGVLFALRTWSLRTGRNVRS